MFGSKHLGRVWVSAAFLVVGGPVRSGPMQVLMRSWMEDVTMEGFGASSHMVSDMSMCCVCYMVHVQLKECRSRAVEGMPCTRSCITHTRQSEKKHSVVLVFCTALAFVSLVLHAKQIPSGRCQLVLLDSPWFQRIRSACWVICARQPASTAEHTGM